MKLLLLVHGLPIGGTETMVCRLVRHYRKCGIDVSVGCLDVAGELGEQLTQEGVPLVVYGRRQGFDRQLPGRISRHVRSEGFDVIHAHQLTCYVYGVISKVATRVPLVFTEHGRFFPDVCSLKRQMFNRVFGRLVDRITAVSLGVRDSLVNIEKFRADSIDVIYNGVEIPHSTESQPRTTAALAKLKSSPQTRLVGTVGRLDPIKNQRLLISSVAELTKRHADVALIIVGGGPERARLEQHVDALGVRDHVHFLGQRSDVETLLPEFDVFALSSLSEGTPMTILEAMVARVPIVSTAVGGIPEILSDGQSAVLVEQPAKVSTDDSTLPEEFVNAYATALETVLTDGELATRLSDAAHSRVAERFSIERIASQYVSIYEQLVTRQRSRAHEVEEPSCAE